MTFFYVSGVPVPQGSMKSVGKGRMVHSNHAALTAWRTAITQKAQATEVACIPKPNPVAIDVVFHLPRPKTVKRTHPTARIDLDKLVRAVGDALTGVAFEDDGQITTMTATKKYGDLWTGAEIVVLDVESD